LSKHRRWESMQICRAQYIVEPDNYDKCVKLNMALLASDLADLPDKTQAFAQNLCNFGLSRIQVHGLFVLFGLDGGTPRTESELRANAANAQAVVPHDRDIYLDEAVGEFYDGYENILNEFYLRSGMTLKLREIRVTDNMVPVSILYARDNDCLDSSINAINTLSDSSRLMWSLIEALGQSTAGRNRSLVDAYLCGSFQMLLYANSDVGGAQQLNSILFSCQPLVIGEMLRFLARGSCDRFNGYLPIQIPLQSLVSGMSEEYARQIWAFQSHIFFDDQKPISGLEHISVEEWYLWVLNRAKAFDDEYTDQLLPFSRSGVSLFSIPIWNESIENHQLVDSYIFEVWGFKANELRNTIEIMEYKACLIHIVYSSLTQSKETTH
jgi:hypothetical protein